VRLIGVGVRFGSGASSRQLSLDFLWK